MSLNTDKRKTGILGGTFNPPHFAHIGMAEAAIREGGMDRVIIIPNGDPPHKRLSVGAEDRLNMARLAALEVQKRLGLKKSDSVEVSDIEISRSGFSFLASTLEELKKKYPEDRLFFIVGGDALMSMASWYKAEKIFGLADILAFKRQGGLGLSPEPALSYLEKKGARVRLLNERLPVISSTVIREKLSLGEDVSGLMPESIETYIRERGLYICGSQINGKNTG